MTSPPYNPVMIVGQRAGVLSAVGCGLSASDQIGFTAPARIWPKIDDIERSAASLDRDIDANVRDPQFIAGWKTWYQNWRRTYYEPYRGETLGSVRNRLSALSGSDELDAAVERERQTLHGWYENYSRQRLPNGQPVPYPSGLPPTRFGQDPQGVPSWSLPWWFWVAAGGALAFIAWRFYVTYGVVKARGRAIEEKLVPAIAERHGLPGKETVEVLQAGRDASPNLGPLDLAYYTSNAGRDPSAPRGFDLDEDDADGPNFAYDPSRDPLRGRSW